MTTIRQICDQFLVQPSIIGKQQIDTDKLGCIWQSFKKKQHLPEFRSLFDNISSSKNHFQIWQQEQDGKSCVFLCVATAPMIHHAASLFEAKHTDDDICRLKSPEVYHTLIGRDNQIIYLTKAEYKSSSTYIVDMIYSFAPDNKFVVFRAFQYMKR